MNSKTGEIRQSHQLDQSEDFYPVTCLANPFWKRVLDLVLIGLCLPIWLPLAVVVMLWIKLTTRGTLLYCQERVGQDGKVFTLYKFRSMRENAPTSSHEAHMQNLIQADRPMTKLDDLGDDRLIPGGAFLRSSGLDELPQLLNIMRGEMSVVGPRPCISREYALYAPCERDRFDVLPGLTGFWQVNGKNRTTFKEMIILDQFYVRNRSLGLDLLILLKTPLAILKELVNSEELTHLESKNPEHCAHVR